MEHLIRTWWSKYDTGIVNQQYKDSNKKSNSSQGNQEQHTKKQMDNERYHEILLNQRNTLSKIEK